MPQFVKLRINIREYFTDIDGISYIGVVRFAHQHSMNMKTRLQTLNCG